MGEEIKKENKISQLHYDAFISYRHCELDNFVAKTLHKELEAYKLPGNVKRKIKKSNPNAKTKISRVFRDEEELPLSSDLEGNIVEALRNSDWLIVICSPRLKESLWCKKEIETFISMHGSDHVLSVLVEGEPSESFPDELLYKEETVMNSDGSVEIVKRAVEPMAADARGENQSIVKSKLKSEKLRLCAPMFGLSYDQLKQRHREDKLKRISILASVIAAASLILFLVSFLVALKIKAQSDEINRINVELSQKQKEITEKSDEIARQNEQLSLSQAVNLAQQSVNCIAKDDREKALELAYSSLTEYEGIKMPYTDAGRYALTQSLNPYNVTGFYNQEYRITTKGRISHMMTSDDRSILAVWDSSNTLTLWSVEDKQKIYELYVGTTVGKSGSTFVDNNTFLYIWGDELYSVSLDTFEHKKVFEAKDGFLGLYHDIYNHRLVISSFGKTYILDDSNYSELYSVDEKAVKFVNFLEGGYTFCALMDECFIFDSDFNEIFRQKTADFAVLNKAGACLEADTLYIYASGSIKNNDGNYLGKNYIRAYSLSAGNKKWEFQDSQNINDIFLSEYMGDTRIVSFADRDIHILDIKNGKEIDNVSLDRGDSFIWKGFRNNYLGFVTAKTEIGSLVEDTILSQSGLIQCSDDSYSMALVSGSSIFLSKIGDNCIKCYSISYSDDIRIYDGNCKEAPESDVLDRYSDEVKNMEIPYYEMVQKVVFDDKKEYMCVDYSDERVVIYSVDDCKEVFSLDTEQAVQAYLGKDADGNTYWASYAVTYCLSPDYNLIAQIHYVKAIDYDTNELVFEYRNQFYAIPIYSREELLEMAKAKLK